jgi:hypothetical protein
MSSMSHNNGVMIKFGSEHVFESMESFLDVNDNGVGALNLALYLINPLIPFKISFVTKSFFTSI